jgi:hypothetical protein
MPVHDWSRVGANVFHDFHLTWIVEIRNELNGGVLRPDHYAMSAQIVGDLDADMLTLQAVAPTGEIDQYAPCRIRPGRAQLFRSGGTHLSGCGANRLGMAYQGR